MIGWESHIFGELWSFHYEKKKLISCEIDKKSGQKFPQKLTRFIKSPNGYYLMTFPLHPNIIFRQTHHATFLYNFVFTWGLLFHEK